MCSVVLGSISDHNKLLLLKNPDVFKLLILGLFVDLERHPLGPNAAPPYAPVPAETQAIWQRNSAETLQQLALFPSGRDALREHADVMKALEVVAENGMTPEAQEHARERDASPPLFSCTLTRRLCHQRGP